MASPPTAQIQIPLDIPDIEVLSTELTADGSLLIRVESQVETTACGLCGQAIRCTFGHGQEIRLRHLSILGRETYLCLRPRRGQCLACATEPTTTQVLDW